MTALGTYGETPQPGLPLHGGRTAVKRCRTCREAKSLANFAAHNTSRDGRRAHCRECLITGRKVLVIEGPAERAKRAERQARPAWQRSHRAALERYAERYPKAEAARRITAAAIRAGRIERAAHCQAAGCTETRNLEGHHHDYAQPLEVLWVCAAHHRQGHAVGVIRVAAGIPEHYGAIPERA
jgi:hypothetical protein